MNSFWNKKRIFITGHTGFKGSWLAFWLQKLGAEVHGYSLLPPTVPSHYELLKLECNTTIGDIRDTEKLSSAVDRAKPEIVFHLAAQPLVRLSYEQPVNTYETNVIGTLNVLEACRTNPNVRAIINVTSDKCYDNKEHETPYRECDPLGGYDPYSASKACSEILTNSYRNSFLNANSYGTTHNILLASCRAGNVIGGGDWALDRLIPDIMRSAKEGRSTGIRNPKSIRPWQHVLEPLAGYMLLGRKLLEGGREYASAWNFGPGREDVLSVEDLAKDARRHWVKIDYSIFSNDKDLHEAKLLRLDCSKANEVLKWSPVWDSRKALEMTVKWYKNYYENKMISTEENIREYEEKSKGEVRSSIL